MLGVKLGTITPEGDGGKSRLTIGLVLTVPANPQISIVTHAMTPKSIRISLSISESLVSICWVNKRRRSQ